MVAGKCTQGDGKGLRDGVITDGDGAKKRICSARSSPTGFSLHENQESQKTGVMLTALCSKGIDAAEESKKAKQPIIPNSFCMTSICHQEIFQPEHRVMQGLPMKAMALMIMQ